MSRCLDIGVVSAEEEGRFVHKMASDENYIETLSKIEFHIVLSEN